MTVFGDSGWESESDIPGKSRNLEFRRGAGWWVVRGGWKNVNGLFVQLTDIATLIFIVFDTGTHTIQYKIRAG